MDILDFTLLVTTHWIADFVFQSNDWATRKSKEILPLISHTATYTAVWLMLILFMDVDFINLLMFGLVTFLSHTVTDFFTSKIVSRKFANNNLGSNIPNFGAFSVIGLDQVLHYIQLAIAWKYLLIK